MRTPTELKAVMTPCCALPLNFGTLTLTANEVAGLVAVPVAGPSGMVTAALAHRLNVFTFAATVVGRARRQAAAQPAQASAANRTARFLIIVVPFPWLFRERGPEYPRRMRLNKPLDEPT